MAQQPKNKQIAIVDDHKLFRKGLIQIISTIDNEYTVIFEAAGYEELQQKIQPGNPPAVILLDINMPRFDGFAAVTWLNQYYPQTKVLVISMVEKEETVTRMIKLGVKGYLNKDIDPLELLNALDAIIEQGYYYTDFITGRLIHSLQKDDPNTNKKANSQDMSEREKTFLKFTCSELTYSEIAAKMFLSPRTIDGYRDSLFEKLNVKSRIGLALYAIKNGLVNL
jgi:two-component system, NarL family, invasion response regulator UvrY